MKFTCLVLCGVVAVLADVDIFNACPDFRPISNFKFDEVIEALRDAETLRNFRLLEIW